MNRFLQPCVFAAMLLVASIVLTSCVTPPPSYDTLKQDLMLPGVEPAPAPIIDKQDLPTSAETAEEMAPAKAALPDSMSLLDAKRIALADNPDLRSIGHRITSAQARYRRALASYWPSLDLSAGAEHVHRVPQTQVFGGNTIDSGSDSYETYRATLTLSWLLFDGLAREYRVMQARYQETSLQASRADAQRLLCKAVSQSYLTALQARKSMEISRTDRTFNQRLLHDAQKRFEAGSGPETDVLNFQIGVDNADINYLRAQQNLKLSLIMLAELLGRPDATIDPQHGIHMQAIDTSVMIDLREAAAQALNLRPDLQRIMADIQTAHASIGIAKAGYYPQVITNADLGYSNPEWKFSDEDLLLQWGASATWNLFAGGSTRQDVHAAQEEMNAFKADLESSWQQVVSEIRQELINLENVRQRKALQVKITDNTRKIRDKEVKAFKAGTISLTRLNEVQRDLVVAEERLSQDEIEFLQVKENLRAAIGTISELD